MMWCHHQRLVRWEASSNPFQLLVYQMTVTNFKFCYYTYYHGQLCNVTIDLGGKSLNMTVMLMPLDFFSGRLSFRHYKWFLVTVIQWWIFLSSLFQQTVELLSILFEMEFSMSSSLSLFLFMFAKKRVTEILTIQYG